MKYILLLAFSLSTLYSQCQYVSLNDAEIKELKRLIAINSEVKKLYGFYQRLADSALHEAPNPIEIISTEGRLKGDPIKTATANSLKDMNKMYALALSYRLTGDKDYLHAATSFLLKWAEVNKPSADPIDDTNLDAAVEAFDLVKSELSKKDKAIIEAWLVSTAEAEINSKRMVAGRQTATNNWNSHRIKVVGEIAYALGNKTLQDWTIEALKTQLVKNLNPDGSSIDFKLRDALHYHVYDMEPLLRLGIILKRATGIDYYRYVSDSQTSIQKSVNWLLPYLTGEKTHGEYTNTTVKFDLARAKNNEAGHEIGALFQPEKGLKVLTLASYFEPRFMDTAKQLSKNGTSIPDWQTVLNMVMLSK